jgi:RNA polymerase sigma factor (sigma-70 family)
VQTAAAAVKVTARRRRLAPADMEDLRSEVWLKLLRDNRAVLRKFAGRSSLQSYLVIVADRCVLDQQVRMFGKWRPSARARQLGSQAVELERLTRREGLPMEEATAVIRSQGAVAESTLTASVALVGAQPHRRPRTVPWDDCQDVAAPVDSPESQLDAVQCHARAPHVRRALAACLGSLTADERHLVTRRFVHGDSIATIARNEARDQKALYRRLEKILDTLRNELARHSVSAADVRQLLGSVTGPLDGILPTDARG